MKQLLLLVCIATSLLAQAPQPSLGSASSYPIGSVLRSGAVGNGTTDNAAAFAAACANAIATATTMYVPAGTYLTLTPLALNCQVEMDPSAVIKAGASMAQVVTLGSSTYVDNGYWHGGTIDANDLANDGIVLDKYRHYSMASVTVKSALVNNFHVGTGSGVYTSYEFIARDLHGIRSTGTLAAGSAGLLIDSNATDSNVASSIFVGAQTGVIVKTGGNFFTDLHVWSAAAQGWMVTGYDDQGNGNIWKGVNGDTPQTYGLRARGFNTIITSSLFYNNTIFGQDNVAIAIQFDQTTPAASVASTFFNGADASHRWLKDVAITNYTGTVFGAGNQENNVVGQFAFSPKFGRDVLVYSGTTATTRLGADLVQMRSTGVFGFAAGSSVSTSTTSDAGMSRCGSACIALGNGTAADVSAEARIATLTINGDTSMTHAPRLVWSPTGGCGTQSANCAMGAEWLPGQKITLTSWSLYSLTAPVGCSPFGTLQIRQGGSGSGGTVLAAITLTNTNLFAGTGFPINVDPANGALRVVSGTVAAAGCSTNSATLYNTIEYKMQ